MIDWFFFFNLSPCVPRGGAIFEGPGRVMPEGCPRGGVVRGRGGAGATSLLYAHKM